MSKKRQLKITILALAALLLNTNVHASNFLKEHPLPTAPNIAADQASLSGIDQDNNGLRDLIDIQIIKAVENKCTSEREKEEAYKKLKDVFIKMKPTNERIDTLNIKSQWLALPCGLGNGGYSEFYEQFKIVVDTDERLRAAEAHAVKLEPGISARLTKN